MLRSLGYNQLTSFNAAAVPLGQGTSQATAAAIGNAAGTGYARGDLVSVVGAGNLGFAATVQVTSVSAGGVVTGIALVDPGYYVTGSTPGANAATTTRGAGTGLTVTLTFGSAGQNKIPQGAFYCEIQLEGGDARYRDDGTAPTTGVGFLLKASTSTPTPYTYRHSRPDQVQIIGAAVGSIANVQFFGVASFPPAGAVQPS